MVIVTGAGVTPPVQQRQGLRGATPTPPAARQMVAAEGPYPVELAEERATVGPVVPLFEISGAGLSAAGDFDFAAALTQVRAGLTPSVLDKLPVEVVNALLDRDGSPTDISNYMFLLGLTGIKGALVTTDHVLLFTSTGGVTPSLPGDIATSPIIALPGTNVTLGVFPRVVDETAVVRHSGYDAASTVETLRAAVLAVTADPSSLRDVLGELSSLATSHGLSPEQQMMSVIGYARAAGLNITVLNPAGSEVTVYDSSAGAPTLPSVPTPYDAARVVLAHSTEAGYSLLRAPDFTIATAGFDMTDLLSNIAGVMRTQGITEREITNFVNAIDGEEIAPVNVVEYAIGLIAAAGGDPSALTGINGLEVYRHADYRATTSPLMTGRNGTVSNQCLVIDEGSDFDPVVYRGTLYAAIEASGNSELLAAADGLLSNATATVSQHITGLRNLMSMAGRPLSEFQLPGSVTVYDVCVPGTVPEGYTPSQQRCIGLLPGSFVDSTDPSAVALAGLVARADLAAEGFFQITGLTATELGALSRAQIEEIPIAKLAELSDSQVRAVVGNLTDAQRANATLVLESELPTECPAAEYFSIASLTATQLGTLSAEQVASIPVETLAKLTQEQVVAAVGSLNDTQRANATLIWGSELPAKCPAAEYFTIASLTAEQAAALPTSLLASALDATNKTSVVCADGGFLPIATLSPEEIINKTGPGLVLRTALPTVCPELGFLDKAAIVALNATELDALGLARSSEIPACPTLPVCPTNGSLPLTAGPILEALDANATLASQVAGPFCGPRIGAAADAAADAAAEDAARSAALKSGLISGFGGLVVGAGGFFGITKAIKWMWPAEVAAPVVEAGFSADDLDVDTPAGKTEVIRKLALTTALSEAEQNLFEALGNQEAIHDFANSGLMIELTPIRVALAGLVAVAPSVVIAAARARIAARLLPSNTPAGSRDASLVLLAEREGAYLPLANRALITEICLAAGTPARDAAEVVHGLRLSVVRAAIDGVFADNGNTPTYQQILDGINAVRGLGTLVPAGRDRAGQLGLLQHVIPAGYPDRAEILAVAVAVAVENYPGQGPEVVVNEARLGELRLMLNALILAAANGQPTYQQILDVIAQARALGAPVATANDTVAGLTELVVLLPETLPNQEQLRALAAALIAQPADDTALVHGVRVGTARALLAEQDGRVANPTFLQLLDVLNKALVLGGKVDAAGDMGAGLTALEVAADQAAVILPAGLPNRAEIVRISAAVRDNLGQGVEVVVDGARMGETRAMLTALFAAGDTQPTYQQILETIAQARALSVAVTTAAGARDLGLGAFEASLPAAPALIANQAEVLALSTAVRDVAQDGNTVVQGVKLEIARALLDHLFTNGGAQQPTSIEILDVLNQARALGAPVALAGDRDAGLAAFEPLLPAPIADQAALVALSAAVRDGGQLDNAVVGGVTLGDARALLNRLFAGATPTYQQILDTLKFSRAFAADIPAVGGTPAQYRDGTLERFAGCLPADLPRRAQIMNIIQQVSEVGDDPAAPEIINRGVAALRVDLNAVMARADGANPARSRQALLNLITAAIVQ
jgi:hypothetical protein